MMADAKEKNFDVLLIDDLSRLSRDNIETQQALKRMKFWRLRVIAVSEGFDTNSKGYKIHAGAKGLMNDLYLEAIAEWTHRGQEGQAQKGLSCGGRVYGYDNEETEDGIRRVINPKEAHVVEQMFQWRIDKLSERQIASELNRLKIPAPRSGSWSMSAIHAMLNNPIYIGRVIWNKTQWIKDPDTGIRKRFERPETEWIVTEIPELRIVSGELWNKVQARKEQTSPVKIHSGRGPKFPFSSLLECGCCGSNYVVMDRYKYGCAGRKDRGPTVCNNDLKVSRKVIEDRLLEAIKADLFTDEAMELFVKEANRLLTERMKDKLSSKDDLRKRLEEANKRIGNIMSAIEAGILTESTKSALLSAEAEKKEVERKLAHNPGLDKVTAFLPRAADSYRKLVNELERTIQTDALRARALLRKLLGGKVRLIPEDGGLIAEIRGDYAGLLSITAPKIMNGSGDRI